MLKDILDYVIGCGCYSIEMMEVTGSYMLALGIMFSTTLMQYLLVVPVRYNILTKHCLNIYDVKRCSHRMFMSMSSKV